MTLKESEYRTIIGYWGIVGYSRGETDEDLSDNLNRLSEEIKERSRADLDVEIAEIQRKEPKVRKKPKPEPEPEPEPEPKKKTWKEKARDYKFGDITKTVLKEGKSMAEGLADKYHERNDDEILKVVGLPRGWGARESSTTGKTYYHNYETDEYVWKKPTRPATREEIKASKSQNRAQSKKAKATRRRRRKTTTR